jgi:hypothetical protein
MVYRVRMRQKDHRRQMLWAGIAGVVFVDAEKARLK